MIRWRSLAAAIACGVALGIASAYWSVRTLASANSVQNGAWQTNLATGSAAADMYSRAAVAVAGLLALNKSETIYFTAWQDDAGDPLSDRCEYRIEGGRLAARWWSVTLYGADHFLVANPIGRYSFSESSVHWSGDSYNVAVAPTEKAGDWLPSAGAGAFSLTARLYGPEPSVYEHPESTPLPRITKVGCS